MSDAATAYQNSLIAAGFALALFALGYNFGVKSNQYDFSCANGCEIMQPAGLEPMDAITPERKPR